MQPPQKTIRDYYFNNKKLHILGFVGNYLLSKYLNERFLFYKYVLKSVPANENYYEIAIVYQGPTDIIDFYVGYKVRACQRIS